jgi:MFS family permease
LSDRFGREIVWSLSCLGYVICYAALLLLSATPSQPLMWIMVLSQGLLGYAIAAIMGPVVAEIFEGPRFGSIFSLLMVALIGGGAVGPFVTGLLHDLTGTYTIAFALGIAFSVICAAGVWIAAPRKVRVVAGSLK